MEVFPTRLRKLWNDLELRFLVLVSLFLQIVLISTGKRRKYIKHRWIAVTLWLCYLSADAVATLSLGVLSQAQEDEKSSNSSYTIMAFWAPFLLTHLGGPDTITAYALADNELWSRHLLVSLTQAGTSIYVLLRSWNGDLINYLWIVVMVPGLVKYWERTFALFLASRDQFRELMVSRPDPGPNYAKFMDELVSKEEEGYIVSLGKAIDDKAASLSSVLSHPAENSEEGVVLQEAYSFFGTFKKLFADLILSFQDKADSLSFFKEITCDKAFKIVEVELGLVYDLFYTKGFIIYSPYGLLLRLLTFSSTVAASVVFLIIDKKGYPKTEVIITYILLVGAILLEIYAVLILISSDRMMIWLSSDRTTLPKLKGNFKSLIVFVIKRVVPLLRQLHIVPAKDRWSNAMGQYDLLARCLQRKPDQCIKLHKLLVKLLLKCIEVYEYMRMYFFWKSKTVPEELKMLIYDELKERAEDDGTKIESYKDDKILRTINYYDKEDIHDLQFDHRVILWHLATDFCYHSSDEESTAESSDLKVQVKREICRLLSNYMMHLLVISPHMLPRGVGQIRFQDTCAEVTEFFEKQNLSIHGACKMLLEVNTRYPPSQVKGDRSKSLLFDACGHAQRLEKLPVKDRWKMITQAWLDLLTFAAAQCRWNDHAEKLSQGGELLTHVWLLMAHFGMTDQFQISQGFVRAKLSLE